MLGFVMHTRLGAALLASIGLLLASPRAPAAAQNQTLSPPRLQAALSFAGILAELKARGLRVENSPAEADVFDYIASTCRDLGLDPAEIDFAESPGGYSRSTILEASIPGLRSDCLVLAVPVDSWIDSSPEGDGTTGLALALATLARLQNQARAGELPPISLRFVFLGAERRGLRAQGEEASLGTATWLAKAILPERVAVLYLSLDDMPEAVAIENAGTRVLSPLWYYDRTRLALEDAGFRLRLDANRMQIYRLGLADSYGPAAPYLAAGLPALTIRGEGRAQAEAPGASPAEELGRRFSLFFDRLLEQNRGGFSEDWDRHYLIFQLGGLSAVVREPVYVVFLLCFCMLAVGAALVLSVTRREALKAVAHRVPLMTAQLLSLFLALCAVFVLERGGAFIDALVIGSGGFWHLAPRVFAVSRIVSGFFLFLAAMSLMVERKILTPNPYFYEFAALVCLAVDIFVFAAIRLPLSFYFVWAFIVVGLSLALRTPSATLVACGIMYAPLLLLAAELILRPELSVYQRIIAPGAGGMLTLAATTLPFFAFMVSPLLFYSKHGARARSRAALVFVLVAFLSEAGALGYAAGLFGSPETRNGGGMGDAAIRLSETLDQNQGRFTDTLSADRRIGRGLLFRGNLALPYYSASDKALLEGRDEQKPLRLGQSKSFFLDRVTDRISLSFAQLPYSLRLGLRGDAELQIYDCDLPYRVSLDGRSVEIFAPVNPGPSLEFSLTVPGNFRARLDVSADYLHPLASYRSEGGGQPVEGSFSATLSAELLGEEGG